MRNISQHEPRFAFQKLEKGLLCMLNAKVAKRSHNVATVVGGFNGEPRK